MAHRILLGVSLLPLISTHHYFENKMIAHLSHPGPLLGPKLQRGIHTAGAGKNFTPYAMGRSVDHSHPQAHQRPESPTEKVGLPGSPSRAERKGCPSSLV